MDERHSRIGFDESTWPAGRAGLHDSTRLAVAPVSRWRNAQGVLRWQAILQTNNSDAGADVGKGLKQSNTNFAVGGTFNFVNPGNNNGSYGVRFVDTTGGPTGDDFVGLSVHGTTSGGAVVEMIHRNNVNGDSTALVPEPAEYALMLAGLGLVGWVVRRKRG